MKIFCFSVILALSTMVTLGLDNGLAKTPPMGWMSWERFRCVTDCKNEPNDCISAKLLMQIADRMVDDGFLELGYEYLAVDDCWMASERNSTDGRLVADPERFPNGMKAVADYIHSRGLKFGIYGDVGLKTCMGRPGNQYYIPLDAETYASWGVDMLKIDCCYTSPASPFGIETMGFFLNRTGRHIYYNCGGCVNVPTTHYKFGAHTCNAVRVSTDVQDDWHIIKEIIDVYAENKGNFADLAGPGYWNDADELAVGDFGMSEGQQKAQMGMWALLTTPLFMSVDLRNIEDTAKQILQNKDIIAINQDPTGVQARRTFKYNVPNGDIEGWLKPLTPKGRYAVGILNTSNDGRFNFINVTMAQLGLTNDQGGYTLKDVYTGTIYGPYKLKDTLITKIPPTSLFLAIADPKTDF